MSRPTPRSTGRRAASASASRGATACRKTTATASARSLKPVAPAVKPVKAAKAAALKPARTPAATKSAAPARSTTRPAAASAKRPAKKTTPAAGPKAPSAKASLALVAPKSAKRAAPRKPTMKTSLNDLIQSQTQLLDTLQRAGYLSAADTMQLTGHEDGFLKPDAPLTPDAVAKAAALSARLTSMLSGATETSSKRAENTLEILDAITRICNTRENATELFAALLATLQHAVPFEGGTLFLLDLETQKLEPVATRGCYTDLIEGVNFQLGSGFSAWVAREKKPVLLANVHRTVQPAIPAVRSFLCVPLLVQDQLVGVVNLSDTKPGAFTEEHKRLLTLVGAQAAGVLQRIAHTRQRDTQSLRDTLTGLYGRPHFDECLRHEIERAKRSALPVSIAVVDVDHLESLNKSLGHEESDQLIAALGALFRQIARGSDVVARLNGGRFAVLFPGAEPQHALGAAERIRNAVHAYAFPHRRRLTVSVGVATCPRDADTSTELVERADIALYLAKNGGRNRVASYPSARAA